MYKILDTLSPTNSMYVEQISHHEFVWYQKSNQSTFIQSAFT